MKKTENIPFFENKKVEIAEIKYLEENQKLPEVTIPKDFEFS